MLCPKCGQDNPAEAKFCGKCATRLSPTPSTFSAPVSTTGGAGDVSQGMKIGIIVGSIVIPLLGIIMGLIYMNDANPSKKAAGKIWLFTGIGVIAFYCICALASGVLQNANNF
jgi:uncharacterized membrane protein YvbJ